MADDTAPEPAHTETPTPTPRPATGTITTTATPPAVPDLNKLLDAAVARYGDSAAAFKGLVAENYSLKDDLKAARSKLPKDGSRVIEGDDLKHFDAYRELGSPAEIRRAKEERDALAVKVATHERQAVLRDVAEKAKVSYPVLVRLASDDLTFEPKTVKVQGKDVEVMHVKEGDGDAAKLIPFDDYAAKHWAEFLPALKPDGASAGTTRPNSTPNRHEVNPNLSRENGAPRPPDAKARHLATIAGAF